MTKLRWVAVAAVVVLGVLSQMPASDHASMADHVPSSEVDVPSTATGAASGTAPAGADRAIPSGRMRVLLGISGMT